MTKVSVFGEKYKKKSEKKPISLLEFLGTDGRVSSCCELRNSRWDNLKLIERAGCGEYDIILAFDGTEENPTNPTVMIGHWNDGVV